MCPSSYQKRTKATNRQKVLQIIGAKRPSFKELKDEARLSPPVLSQYLRELQRDDSIKRQIDGKRIFYELTDRGLNAEQRRKESVAKGTDLVRFLIRSPVWVEGMNEMANFARESPEFFEVYIQWYSEYVAIMMSEEGIAWLNKYGKASSNILKSEIAKRLASVLKTRKNTTLGPEELRTRLQYTLDALQDIISGDKSRRK